MDYKYYELKKDRTTYNYYSSLANLFPGPEGGICQTTPVTTTQPQYLYHGYTMHVLRNTDCGSAAHRNLNVEQIPIMYNFYYSDGDYIGKMLDEFGLINMNGRCYDPVVGRFLSPDIVVQNPNSTQCYNRYSYAVNNPLKYTDPSGWSFVPSVYWRTSSIGMQRRAIDLIFSKIWKPSEFKELSGLLQMAGGNSLNNAGAPLDICDQQLGAFKMSIGNMEKRPSVNFLYGASAIGNILKTTGLARLFGNPKNGNPTPGNPPKTEDKTHDLGVSRSFLAIENMGYMGSFFYSWAVNVFEGKDNKYYSKFTASAWAPMSEWQCDAIDYTGSVKVIVDGKAISESNFFEPENSNGNILIENFTWLGNAYNELPKSGDFQLKINISYNAYTFYTGWVPLSLSYNKIINYHY